MDTDRIIQKYIILLGQQTHNNVVLETDKEILLKENEDLRKEIDELKGIEKTIDEEDKKEGD